MMKSTNKNTREKMTVSVIFAVMGAALLITAALFFPAVLSGCAGNTEDSTPETTVTPDTTVTDTTASSDTTSESEPEPEIIVPEFINPLTGLEADKDLSTSRPAAIMINNIKVSCPQIGIRNIDVMYECLAEGDITRLLCLASDYAALGEIGSVRSARDYFIDFAQNHDALFVHAGGSPYAYTSIDERDIDNLDGVNMYFPNEIFYRDQDRRVNMGYEHSLMTSGENIVEGIKYRKYRTELQNNFDSPFDFVDYGITRDLSNAEDSMHVYLPFSASEKVDMIYDPETGLYDRYQFGGIPHIDGETGEQIKFTNIFVLFCNSSPIPDDDKDRIRVGTVGNGKGYYITGGKSVPITWEKEDNDSPIKFTTENGDPLEINRGKTYIAVMSKSAENKILLNKSDS